MGLAMPGGGANLGQAQGTITLNTTQLAAAVATARGLAQQLQQSMNAAGTGATRVTGGFTQMAASLRDVRGELLAISAASGLLTKIGMQGALNLRNYTIAFRQFVNSQKEAEALTNRLIGLANKYGLEWENVAQLGRALLPSLKGGAAELDGWISRAARLRSLFPTAQRGSETIAISEFLAGQSVSLQRRFNIPMDVIKEAKAKFNDLGQALDFILEKRGATEEAALAMANAFVGVRNELVLLLAQGFTPLFQALQPILTSIRQFASTVRETSPGLTTAAAGFIALTAAAAPTLLILNQLVIAAEKLKALGILGGLGKAGGVGLAVAAGIGVGTGVANAVGTATGNEKMANATFGSAAARLWEVLRMSLGIFAQALGQLQRIIKEGLVSALQSLVNVVIRAATAIGGVVSMIANLLPGSMGAGLGKVGADLSAGGAGIQAASDKMFAGIIDSINKSITAQELSIAKFLVPERFRKGTADDDSDIAPGGGDPNADRNAVISQWAKDAARIERDAAEARLQATQDYERQRTEMITQYNLSALREQEDYERNRARAIANFNRQVAEFAQDAAKREATWQRDLNEKLADLREDSNERLAELEEDYARDREKAARDHRNRLIDAAARLDAVAIREEQRRFAEQSQDAKENFTDRVDKERENLAERIQEEQEAHQQRLQDQRDADAERLADMQRAFEEQKAEEDFERQLRLQRQAEDFAHQLQQQEVAQAERLAQISRQAALEKQALDESFMAKLEALGIHNEGWLRLQAAQQTASIKLFDEWWKEMQKRFAIQDVATRPAPAWNVQFPNYNQIGPQTNPANTMRFPSSWLGAMDNAGGDLPAAAQRQAGAAAGRAAAGGLPVPGTARQTGSSTNRSITVAEGAIVVNAASGQNEEVIARAVERRMRSLLEGLAA